MNAKRFWLTFVQWRKWQGEMPTKAAIPGTASLVFRLAVLSLVAPVALPVLIAVALELWADRRAGGTV